MAVKEAQPAPILKGEQPDLRLLRPVLAAIERIAEGSRSVADSAQQIASATARHGHLTAELAGSREGFEVSHRGA